MKFLGIDLGWQSQLLGLCCLDWQDGSLRLLELTRRDPIDTVLAWVDSWVTPTDFAMIAVDAPTLITNQTNYRSNQDAFG